MVKNILSVLAGLGIGLIVLFGLEGISGKLYPAPDNLDMNNREALAAYIRNMPMGAVLVIVLSYIIASFIGGYIASRISKKMKQGIIVGIFLLVAGIMNVIMLPHPLWMAILMLAVYVPSAWLGAKLATVKG